MRTINCVAVLLAFLAIGCGKTNPYVIEDKEQYPFQEGEISYDSALNTLNDFLAETSIPLSKTKGDGGRVITSVGTYYSKQAANNTLPDAYVVNFEEGHGFAVLGAHDRVAPVIAVTEKGCIDPQTLKISAGNLLDDKKTAHLSELIEEFLRNGASPNSVDHVFDDGVAPFHPDEPGEPGPDGPNLPYIHYSAHINTTWDQGEWNRSALYNNYCYEDFIFDGFMYVYTGCSTTAMAGIVEYNRFPTTLIVNGKTLNYSAMDEYPNAHWLPSESAKDDVARLMGAIFHNVFRLFSRHEGTCITPAQIENCMNHFGYSNVVRLQGSRFTSEMKAATKEMLNANKPVFISAIPSSNIAKAHSWVIDEIKGRKTHDVHCNWGWSGYYDGFYSTSCFEVDGDVYDFHFRVITYDIPSEQVTKSFDF